MARPPRSDFEGALHHVTARGNARLPIYLDGVDHALFSLFLADVVDRYAWIVHSYCQMTNHYHLVLETPEGKLGRGMRDLNGRFARAFNARHRRENHVFGGRYATSLIESEPHLLEACRYVVLNPVRAGICRRPQDWPWSSYSAAAGLGARPAWLETTWLLAQFAGDEERAKVLYRDFVSEGMSRSDLSAALGVRHVSGTLPRTPPDTRARFASS
jgi:REP element-mobilizing transposase RayT